MSLKILMIILPIKSDNTLVDRKILLNLTGSIKKLKTSKNKDSNWESKLPNISIISILWSRNLKLKLKSSIEKLKNKDDQETIISHNILMSFNFFRFSKNRSSGTNNSTSFIYFFFLLIYFI